MIQTHDERSRAVPEGPSLPRALLGEDRVVGPFLGQPGHQELVAAPVALGAEFLAVGSCRHRLHRTSSRQPSGLLGQGAGEDVVVGFSHGQRSSGWSPGGRSGPVRRPAGTTSTAMSSSAPSW